MRLRRLLGYSTLVSIALVLLASGASGQVQPQPIIPFQMLDNNGKMLTGGCLATFQSGTATPLGTFSDAAGTVPNTNPVQLDSSGRATVFLQAQAYTLKLYVHGVTNNCATSLGPLIWSIDGINPSANSILVSNNTWTGTNTFEAATVFDGPVTFNAGFTSNGPSDLTAGGSVAGTFTGSAVFSGSLAFNTITVQDATFVDPWVSTVGTGFAPFIVNSTTEVANLNSNFLEGCDWASPCPIGTTTPNTAIFTTLRANTSFILNGSATLTGIQGSDVHLMTAGTIAGGAGSNVCLDANSGLTTSGCASGFSQIQSAKIASPCTPGSASSYDACDSTLTWPAAFADTNYFASCSALGTGYNVGSAGSNNSNFLYIRSKATTTMSITIQNGRGAADAPTEVDCVGVHP